MSSSPLLTPDSYELTPATVEALRDLVDALVDVEKPVERIAAIRAVERRVRAAIVGSLLRIALDEARAEGASDAAIRAAYGLRAAAPIPAIEEDTR